MPGLRLGVERLSPPQQLVVQPGMALCRCQKFDRAMAVLMVIPDDELMNSAPCCTKTIEGPSGICGRVFECPEQRLRVRVVITHRRTTERRHNSEPLQGSQHRRTFHWAPIVGVQSKLTLANALSQTGLADQCAGMLSPLLGMYLPADDLAASAAPSTSSPAK